MIQKPQSDYVKEDPAKTGGLEDPAYTGPLSGAAIPAGELPSPTPEDKE